MRGRGQRLSRRPVGFGHRREPTGARQGLDKDLACGIGGGGEAYDTVFVAAHDQQSGGSAIGQGQEGLDLTGHFRGSIGHVAIGRWESEGIGVRPDLG